MSLRELSEPERSTLATFCDVCDALAKCRFVREFRERSGPIMVGTLPDGTVVSEHPEYDREDMCAFATDYRKLTADGERTSIYKVMSILGRVCSDEERLKLKESKREIKAEGKAWWGIKVASNPAGGSECLTSREIEDAFFNGRVFHTDEDKKHEFNQIEKYGPHWEHAFLRYAMTVVHYARLVAEMIRVGGYAEAVEAPAANTQADRGTPTP